MIHRVDVSKRAERGLASAPKQVAEHGLDFVKTIPGYHDEPLAGKLRGHCRSIRLALGYRAYYRLVGETVKCVLVEEVNKHDYKKIERLFGL